ncbi:MAG: hypothetical protein JXB49_08775 [Bacteroidales bacterium]|nr:hypothetical protein [Bacteroidales bacterium]
MGKSPRILITEIFMAKAGKNGWDRCFHGTIRRETVDGNPVVYGKIKVNDGYIYAKASSQEDLGTQLDEMVFMILDGGLHSDEGKFLSFSNLKHPLN